jgi:hypothetical protein
MIEGGAGAGVVGDGTTGGVGAADTPEGAAGDAEGDAVADGAVGVGVNLSGTKSGGGEVSLFSLGSVFLGSFDNCCCWAFGGIPGPDCEAPLAGLFAAAGVGEGLFPERANGGAAGVGTAAAGLTGGSGGFISVASMALAGTIAGDADLFAGGSFFTSGEGSDGGAVGVAGDLFSFDPLGDFPHSFAPITCGKVGFGSTGPGGGSVAPIWGLVFSGLRFSFLDGNSQPAANVVGSPRDGEPPALAAGWVGFKGGSFGMFGGGISNGTGFFSSRSGAAGSTGSPFASFGASELVGSCILSPITAPVRHRNVQVRAIPILCSHFMRDLLCSDELRCRLRLSTRDAKPQAATDLTPVRLWRQSGRSFSVACTSASGRRPRPRNDRRCRPAPLPDAARRTGPDAPGRRRDRRC